MDDKQDNSTPLEEATPASSEASKTELTQPDVAAPQKPLKAVETTTKKKHSHTKKVNHNKKGKKHISVSDDSASSSEEDEDSEEESEESSDDTSDGHSKKEGMRKTLKKMMRQMQKKAKHGRRATDHSESSSSSESDESESSDEHGRHRRRRRHGDRSRPARRSSRREDVTTSEDDYGQAQHASTSAQYIDHIQGLLDNLKLQTTQSLGNTRAARTHGRKHLRYRDPSPPSESDHSVSPVRHNGKSRRRDKDTSGKQYKRIDEVWDSSIYNYKIVETAESQEDEFEQYVFTVRRKFDWENRPKLTTVDVRSKYLRDALKEILKDVKGVVLDTEKPEIDPNLLFMYLDEIRQHIKALKSKLKKTKKRKEIKRLKTTRKHCKVLIEYLDEDYREIKKTLKGLLKQGMITFELLWAIFKPNCIAYTPTYGSSDDPRCFKVDLAEKCVSFMRGEWYCVEGRYLEFDGKSFGLGEFDADVDSFKGPRKITSLSCYPLHFHKDVEGVTKQLVDRGKKFVALDGMSYKAFRGMAYIKKKKGVAKININGRIIVDGATFRRINANYPISPVKVADNEDELLSAEDSDCSECCSSGEEGKAKDESKPKKKWKAIPGKTAKGKVHLIQVEVDENGQTPTIEKIDKLPDKQKKDFTQEEYLISSPVVYGFAFSEKLWLEFSVSSIKEIEWNETAFDSLVLPDGQKSIVKALVESHKYEAARTIDDVVQGKGKGLVAVLHGPPGTGKTLTAEGIAELLKCPLYMVSVGELGTEPARLEDNLNRILDMAHTWGALILLDEADVFLERRQTTDIHRNALVSVFLRLLEYFQGILFLTTNRVETFDEAFQSRIHLALKYGDLTVKARRTVWKMFLERIRDVEDAEVDTAGQVDGEAKGATAHEPAFTETDYDVLARKVLNGRQIKNVARTAQALALNEGRRVGLEHVKRVLEVQDEFNNDLKGGTGFVEAMRSYT